MKVRRRNRVYVLCTANPKHKQRQGLSHLTFPGATTAGVESHFSESSFTRTTPVEIDEVQVEIIGTILFVAAILVGITIRPWLYTQRQRCRVG